MMRSFGTMKDYAVAATDGEPGGIEAPCLDDPSWAVRHHSRTSCRAAGEVERAAA